YNVRRDAFVTALSRLKGQREVHYVLAGAFLHLHVVLKPTRTRRAEELLGEVLRILVVEWIPWIKSPNLSRLGLKLGRQACNPELTKSVKRTQADRERDIDNVLLIVKYALRLCRCVQIPQAFHWLFQFPDRILNLGPVGDLALPE